MAEPTHQLSINPALRPVRWQGDALELLDQRLLPKLHQTITCRTPVEVAEAITSMVVRGAPAIAFAGAWGMVLAASQFGADQQRLTVSHKLLLASRPTAVNLRWALQRLEPVWRRGGSDLVAALEREAAAIEREDLDGNRAMGEAGLQLLQRGADRPQAVLTHCNTGALATAGLGTALGVIRYGHAAGAITKVYADETRPWLQGARLTAYELLEDGIQTTLLADSAAASLLAGGEVGWVIVGADRICANGDVVNKVGTYGLALAASAHNVGFMVVAHSSTLDPETASGSLVPIEQRPSEEVLRLAGVEVAAAGALAWNPGFDVTPAGLITALVTEKGVLQQPATTGIAPLL